MKAKNQLKSTKITPFTPQNNQQTEKFRTNKDINRI